MPSARRIASPSRCCSSHSAHARARGSARAELGVIAAAAAAGARAGLDDLGAATPLCFQVGPADAVAAAAAHDAAVAGGGRAPAPPLAAACLPLAHELHAAAAELLLVCLRVAPPYLAAPLAAACTRPLLRAVCGALAAAPACDGVLPALLLLLLRCVRAHSHAHELPDAFVPCLAAGLRAHGSVAWGHWVVLALGSLPHAGESLASVALTTVTSLSELPQREALSAPQLALALHALHDVSYFCVLGRVPARAESGGVGSEGGPPLRQRGRSFSVVSHSAQHDAAAVAAGLGAATGALHGSARESSSHSLLGARDTPSSGGGGGGVGGAGGGLGAGVTQAQWQLARMVLFQQAPVLIHALLHIYNGRHGALDTPDAPAPPLAPAALRALALRPLALLSASCGREFLCAAVFVWEGSSPLDPVGQALLASLNQLPRAQPRELLATAAEVLVGAPS
ncbi:hypothetical protein T492DRAFT_901263, partial [Pavlovales sp. CCMP2436]